METTKDNIDPLTEQETNILKLIADGHTNKDISEILNISPLTVKTHRQRIIIKFHAQNFCEVINKAAKSGLI
jgi:DNA-binding CsgD family transcriptional regulator